MKKLVLVIIISFLTGCAAAPNRCDEDPVGVPDTEVYDSGFCTTVVPSTVNPVPVFIGTGTVVSSTST
jgi:hypothetical protein